MKARDRALRPAMLLAMTVFAAVLAGGASLRAAIHQSEAVPSPEESVLLLKPLELGSADVPAGFAAGDTSTSTPVVEAVAQANAGADPYGALDELQAEGTQVCSAQDIVPPSDGSLSQSSLTSCVMVSPAAAAAVAAGSARPLPTGDSTLTITPLTPPPLGDGTTGAWQLTSTAASGQPVVQYDLRWTRGIIAFELATTASPQQSDPSASAALAATLDAAEAGRAAAALSTPLVNPPASEQQRLYTALLEQDALVPPSQPPVPMSTIYSQAVVHPADSVLSAANPPAFLRTVDQQYKRLIYTNRVYRTPNKLLVHGQRVTVDADAQGATQELRAQSTHTYSFRVDANDMPLPGPQTAYELIPAPMQLGDSTVAYRITTSYPNIPNAPSEISYNIGWTHGRVYLQAQYSTLDNRQPTAQDVVPWAQEVEAMFEASPLSSMTADLTPTATPSPASLVAHTAAPEQTAALPPLASPPSVLARRRRPRSTV